MKVEIANHRHAKEILEAKGIFNNIIDSLKSLRIKNASDIHNEIQNHFLKSISVDWEKEKLITVTQQTIRNQSLDLYSEKYKVGIEIETSRWEFLYRDYMRFLRSDRDNLLDVGIVIVFKGDILSSQSKKWPGHTPKLKDVIDDFKVHYSTLTIPILALGINLE